MTTKKISMFVKAVILSFIPIASIAQSSICDYGGGSGSINQVYDPTTMITGRTTSSPNYHFHETVTTNSFYTSNAAGIESCIDRATNGIWAHILGTLDPNLVINIKYVFTDMGWGVGNYHLMGTSVTTQHDFGTGYAGTAYNQSEANFLWSQAHGWTTGNNWTSDDMTITINTNSNIHWNFDWIDPCPPTLLDFQTVLIHEICHGLGFHSNVDGIIPWLDGSIPSIYDRFVNDDKSGAGCSYNPATYLIDLYDDGTTNFQNFCNGAGGYNGIGCTTTSNTVWLNSVDNYTYGTSGTLDQIAQLYAPYENYTGGTSISHTNENSDPSTGNAIDHELMDPRRNNGVRFMPSTADLQILNVIGWQINYTVGFHADASILSNDGVSAPPALLTVDGTSYGYSIVPASSDYVVNGTWTLILYADDGPQTITTSTSTTASARFFYASLSSLPGGHTWTRDIDGNITGVLTFNGQGSDGLTINENYSVQQKIAVSSAPQWENAFSITTASTGDNCDKWQLNYYAKGATYYNIYESHNSDIFTWDWSTPTIIASPLQGATSYIVTGLNNGKP